jgi:hypothetical protein
LCAIQGPPLTTPVCPAPECGNHQADVEPDETVWRQHLRSGANCPAATCARLQKLLRRVPSKCSQDPEPIPLHQRTFRTSLRLPSAMRQGTADETQQIRRWSSGTTRETAREGWQACLKYSRACPAVWRRRFVPRGLLRTHRESGKAGTYTKPPRVSFLGALEQRVQVRSCTHESRRDSYNFHSGAA